MIREKKKFPKSYDTVPLRSDSKHPLVVPYSLKTRLYPVQKIVNTGFNPGSRICPPEWINSCEECSPAGSADGECVRMSQESTLPGQGVHLGH